VVVVQSLSTQPLGGPAAKRRRNATLRAWLAIVAGFLAIAILTVFFGACLGWTALLLPFVAAYAVFELFTVRESQQDGPMLLWQGVCPGCGYSLLRSGKQLATQVPDVRTRRALSSHERTVRCSECGASWDLGTARSDHAEAGQPQV
jgi:hypothetical protein